ncbi:MAG: hypothetical protein ACREJM_06170, partial [Candidatus Saccharimonadales bacterium]
IDPGAGNTQLLSIAPQSGSGAGGTINLTATNISWANSASAPLILNASGVGSGDGGKIFVNLSAGNPVEIGNGTGSFKLTAQSGISSGNGGTISFTANNANLIIDDTSIAGKPDSLLVNPQGSDGNGGKIILSASSVSYTSDTSDTLAIDASGVGTGDGGTVSVTQTGTIPALNVLTPDVNIGTTGTNAVNTFQLTANAGSTGGNGGTVSFVVASAVTQSMPFPGVTLDPAGISVAPAGSGKGGTIILSAVNFIPANGAPMVIDAGVGSDSAGNGGSISITSSSPILLGPDGFQLSANGGSSSGNGGAISVTSTSQFGGITVEDATGLSVSATSGSNGTITLSGQLISSNSCCFGTPVIVAQTLNLSGFSSASLATSVNSLTATGISSANLTIVNTGSITVGNVSLPGPASFLLQTQPDINGN